VTVSLDQLLLADSVVRLVIAGDLNDQTRQARRVEFTDVTIVSPEGTMMPVAGRIPASEVGGSDIDPVAEAFAIRTDRTQPVIVPDIAPVHVGDWLEIEFTGVNFTPQTWRLAQDGQNLPAGVAFRGNTLAGEIAGAPGFYEATLIAEGTQVNAAGEEVEVTVRKRLLIEVLPARGSAEAAPPADAAAAPAS
jgi:hypothetical protein